MPVAVLPHRYEGNLRVGGAGEPFGLIRAAVVRDHRDAHGFNLANEALLAFAALVPRDEHPAGYVHEDGDRLGVGLLGARGGVGARPNDAHPRRIGIVDLPLRDDCGRVPRPLQLGFQPPLVALGVHVRRDPDLPDVGRLQHLRKAPDVVGMPVGEDENVDLLHPRRLDAFGGGLSLRADVDHDRLPPHPGQEPGSLADVALDDLPAVCDLNRGAPPGPPRDGHKGGNHNEAEGFAGDERREEDEAEGERGKQADSRARPLRERRRDPLDPPRRHS